MGEQSPGAPVPQGVKRTMVSEHVETGHSVKGIDEPVHVFDIIDKSSDPQKALVLQKRL